MSYTENVLNEVKAERQYQQEKWGNESDDTFNTPWMWVAYITQYAGSWMKGLFRLDTALTDGFRTAMVKTAAIAVAAAESIDRQREANGKTFYEG